MKHESMDVNEQIRARHVSRLMFAVINDKLHVASKNNPRSHDEWFSEEGWIQDINDPKFEKIVRGAVDPSGDICFYVGKEFRVDPAAEGIFFRHLPKLVERLALSPGAKVSGGKTKSSPGEDWPPRKKYGTVLELIDNLKQRAQKQ